MHTIFYYSIFMIIKYNVELLQNNFKEAIDKAY